MRMRAAVAAAAVAMLLVTPAARAAESTTVDAPWFGSDSMPLAPGQIELSVVSSLPATVTGEDARIQVRGLQDGDRLRVDRDGTDVTSAMTPVRPGVVDGVVGGLHVGVNHVTALVTGPSGPRKASLDVTDHPVTGPVISGPHQTPFICETEANGLGPPLDADCSAKPRVDWFARSVTGRFNSLANPYAAYPPDTATTTTADGRTVPFVVRVESSVINRSVTRVAVLDDPHGRGADKPYSPSPAWNHKLVYSFGESCGPGHHQGVNSPDNALGQVSGGGNPYDNAFAPFIDIPSELGQGYMTAHSTLTILGVECNDVVSAETLMMVKEHVIKAYGRLVHTIGAGASGGAIQQYTAANNYPGLIDGGNAIISFPDMTTTYVTDVDCALLERVFRADPARWTEPKQEAVTGFRTGQICADWVQQYASLVDPKHCDPAVPAALVYDPKKNPHGARCTVQDDQANLWGRDPATGFARRPLDNTGVQYGLRALQQGAITADDFVALNSAVGGFDIDGNPTQQRMETSPDVARTAYDTGRVTGRGALDQTPLIDNHPNLDVVPQVDVHDDARPFMARARMDNHLGGHASQTVWQGEPYPSDGFAPVEQWLTAIEGRAGSPRRDSVAAARPTAASDRCTVLKAGVDGTAPCDAVVASDPRIAAGAPRGDDVIKCTLKPLDAGDYEAALTDAQLAALRKAFPAGVCNWAVPGVGETSTSRPWLAFSGNGPPVQLHNVVARSVAPGTAVLAATDGHAGNATGSVRPGSLPATGGDSRWAVIGAGALLLPWLHGRQRHGHRRAHPRRRRPS